MRFRLLDGGVSGGGRSARAAAVLVLLLAAGCGDDPPAGPATPLEALDALRAVAANGDPRAAYALWDGESLWFRRQRAREWRALLERGDDPAQVLAGANVTPEELLRVGTEELVGTMLLRGSPFVADAAWLAAATVVSREDDGEDAALLRLRGPDGTERDYWFSREGGTWRFDQYRSVF